MKGQFGQFKMIQTLHRYPMKKRLNSIHQVQHPSVGSVARKNCLGEHIFLKHRDRCFYFAVLGVLSFKGGTKAVLKFEIL